jgi:hypothetical protein
MGWAGVTQGHRQVGRMLHWTRANRIWPRAACTWPHHRAMSLEEVEAAGCWTAACRRVHGSPRRWTWTTWSRSGRVAALLWPPVSRRRTANAAHEAHEQQLVGNTTPPLAWPASPRCRSLGPLALGSALQKRRGETS